MSEQKKDNPENESCCDKDSCGCCGCGSGGHSGALKFLLGLMLGIMLAGVGFCLFMAGRCSGYRHASCGYGGYGASCPVMMGHPSASDSNVKAPPQK